MSAPADAARDDLLATFGDVLAVTEDGTIALTGAARAAIPAVRQAAENMIARLGCILAELDRLEGRQP